MDKARDSSIVAIGLLKCCRTPRILQISPAIARNDPDFGKGIAIRTLKFCRILAKSVWFMSSSNFCDSSLNLLISSFLTRVLEELFLMLMFLEHLDQFCDVILTPCILQFHR